MLKIKLTRVGKKKKPLYRLIVQEHTKDPWGDYLENVGNYNPHTKELNVKSDKIKKYLDQGAQVTGTVHNLLVKAGVIEGKKKTASHLSKKRREKIAEAQAKAEEEKAAIEEKAKAEAQSEDNSQEVQAQEETSSADTEEKKSEESVTEEKKETENQSEETKEESNKEEK